MTLEGATGVRFEHNMSSGINLIVPQISAFDPAALNAGQQAIQLTTVVILAVVAAVVAVGAALGGEWAARKCQRIELGEVFYSEEEQRLHDEANRSTESDATASGDGDEEEEDEEEEES